MTSIDGIRIIDATLRDGGLVNDFFFSDDFAKAVYRANVAAGVDCMEFGYRADKKQFEPTQFGKWKFTSDEHIREIIGGDRAELEVSVMVDVGRCDYRRDIHPKSESPVDLFRVATYIETISEAIEMIEYIADMGYRTTCNLMAISKCTDEQLSAAVEALSRTPILGAYVVDSYGALYPKQVRRLIRLYHDILVPAGKIVGIHAHNNQQCAFANTIEAKNCGAKWLDGTAYGMGRGAGNCHLEALLGYVSGRKYHIEPILDLVESHMLPLRDQGVIWGYNTSYMLTGLTNQHPRTAIAATKNDEINFSEQYKYLTYK